MLMWALSHSFCKITIMTQNLKPTRKFIPYQPIIKSISLYLVLLSVLGSTTLNMIDCQKNQIIDSTTGTLPAIMIHDFSFYSYSILFSSLPSCHNSGPDILSVIDKGIPTRLPQLLLMVDPVGSAPTTSALQVRRSPE